MQSEYIHNYDTTIPVLRLTTNIYKNSWTRLLTRQDLDLIHTVTFICSVYEPPNLSKEISRPQCRDGTPSSRQRDAMFTTMRIVKFSFISLSMNSNTNHCPEKRLHEHRRALKLRKRVDLRSFVLLLQVFLRIFPFWTRVFPWQPPTELSRRAKNVSRSWLVEDSDVSSKWWFKRRNRVVKMANFRKDFLLFVQLPSLGGSGFWKSKLSSIDSCKNYLKTHKKA